MLVDLTVGDPTAPEVETEPGDDALLEDELVPQAVLATEDQVRGILVSIGMGANRFARDDETPPNIWKFSKEELDGIVPPLTRIVNQRPKLREAVLRSDEATVAIFVAGYVGRNVEDTRKANKKREENDRFPGEIDPTAAQSSAAGRPNSGPASNANSFGGGSFPASN